MSRVGRANNLAQARRRDRVKGHVGSTREIERDFELEADRFRKLAPILGYCGTCGAVVDEAAGKLHEWDCAYLPAERRKAKP